MSGDAPCCDAKDSQSLPAAEATISEAVAAGVAGEAGADFWRGTKRGALGTTRKLESDGWWAHE